MSEPKDPLSSDASLCDPLATLSEKLLPLDLAKSDNSLAGQAAVLIPLLYHRQTLSMVLTCRARHLSSHPGEIAFPGGKWEPGDAHLVATALRESTEEIALPASQVRLLGQLASRKTRAGVAVTPVLGVIPDGLVLTPDPAELDAIFIAPVAEFLPARVCRTDEFTRGGVRLRLPAFCYQGHDIWGLTAFMASEVAQLLDGSL